jgi:hypothetical protein
MQRVCLIIHGLHAIVLSAEAVMAGNTMGNDDSGGTRPFFIVGFEFSR